MTSSTRRWRLPSRIKMLWATLIVLCIVYVIFEPGPEYVTPPFEIGGNVSVVVIDEKDERISDAVVTPTGLRALQDPGSFYSWQEPEHGIITPVITDKDGRAEIPFPKWVDRTTGLLTEIVPIVVEHPDYCVQDSVECPVPHPGAVTPLTRVQLHRGGRLKIKAFRPDSSQPLEQFQWTASNYVVACGTKTDDGARLSPVFPVGTHLLRVVDNEDPDAIHFSDLLTFKAVADQTDEIEVHLKPAMTVRGKLDCPVPVSNGFVVAHVIEFIPDPITGANLFWRWQTWTKVDSDGEFEFRSLPPSGKVSLQAWCDGYFSQQPDDKSIPAYLVRMKDIRSLPQIFELRDADQVCLIKMTPCYQCLVTVTDRYGLPIEGVECEFYPNTTFDGHGSSLFGFGMRNESERLTSDRSRLEHTREFFKKAPDSNNLHTRFGGRTDAQGKIQINNLVGSPSQPMYVGHNHYVVRGHEGTFNADVRVELQQGKNTTVTVVMVPKPKLTPKMLTRRPASNVKQVIQAIFERIKKFFE